MLKRMMLLAGMALAAVAFMAPAMAQADELYTHTDGSPPEGHTVPVGYENHHEAEFTGFLSSTAGGGAVKSGPCEVHAVVDLWNEDFGSFVTATGEVTDFQITTPCAVTSPFPIIPPGCSLVNATSEDFPWHVTVLPGTELAIGDEENPANFTNQYEGCAPTLPAEVTAEGIQTGTAENVAGGLCINFNNSGDMESPNGAVTVDGQVCADDITLHDEE